MRRPFFAAVCRSVAFGTAVSVTVVPAAAPQATTAPAASDLVSAEAAPAPCPPAWLGLLGLYGAPPSVIMILERDGALEAGIERGHFYVLESLGGDRFRFPNSGRYASSDVTFVRDASGKATSLRLEQAVMPRDALADGVVPRVRVSRPLDDLVRASRAARPPLEPAPPLSADLVEVTKLDPSIRVDLRYAGAGNPLGAPVLSASRAFLQRPAAEALVRAHRALAPRGFGLVILDAYRPWWVTRAVWDSSPIDLRRFLADPEVGSGYNRGTTVDVSLYRLKDGQRMELAGAYGEMSLRAYNDFPGGTSEQRWLRDRLVEAMEREDFQALRTQWWRFDLPEGGKYPVMNLSFEEIPTGRP